MSKNEQLYIIPANATSIDLNLSDNKKISYILFKGNAINGKNMTFERYCEELEDYYPIYLSSEEADMKQTCVADKIIYWNKEILRGVQYRFKLDSAINDEVKMVIFFDV